MSLEATIDAAGRLVLPEKVRNRHQLRAGSRLTLIEQEDRIVIIPRRKEPELIEKDGLLVLAAVGSRETIPDHRDLREDRLDGLTRSK